MEEGDKNVKGVGGGDVVCVRGGGGEEGVERYGRNNARGEKD